MNVVHYQYLSEERRVMGKMGALRVAVQNGAILRCSSLIRIHQTSLLTPCIAATGSL